MNGQRWFQPKGLLIGAATIVVILTMAGGFAAALPQGRLRGGVVTRSPEGQVVYLVGARVTLRQEAGVAPPLVTSSDQSGEFTFNNVSEGRYVIVVELSGFTSVSRAVTITGETEVQIELEPVPVTGEVTVTPETEAINRSESSPPGTVHERTLQNAPLVNERFQDALPLLPGVVRGPDGLINIKGARVSQSGYLVNSANVTDPVTGSFAINLPVDAIEDVQVLSSPYSAEYGRFTGAVTAVSTRPSGDRWEGKVQSILPRLRRRGGRIVGIEAFTPRLFVGGPVVKNRLSLAQSFEYRFVRTEVESLPPLKNDTVLESFDSFSHFTLRLTPNNEATITLSLYPQKNQFVNLNTFNPQPVTPNFKQRGFNLAVLDRAIFLNRSLLESLLSVKQYDANVFPNVEEPMTLHPEGNVGGFFSRQDRESFRYQWYELHHLPTRVWYGQHSLKVGLDVGYSTYQGVIINNTVRILREDRTLAEQIDFSGSARVGRNNTETSAFIQDKWLVTPRLTFDLGLRYERDTIARQNNVASRLGFVIVPWLAGHTAIRGSEPLAAQQYQFLVEHEHTLRHCRGTLTITPDKIEYKTTHKKDSRSWQCVDIRQIKVESPTALEMVTYEDQRRLLGRDRIFTFRLLEGHIAPEVSALLMAKATHPPVTSVMPVTGLNTSFSVFKGVGFKPFMVGLVGALLVGIVGLIMALLVGPYVRL